MRELDWSKPFHTECKCRGAGAGPAGPANAGPMFTPKSRNKRARSWNSNWAAAAQAVNARAAVASSAYIALGYCEVK